MYIKNHKIKIYLESLKLMNDFKNKMYDIPYCMETVRNFTKLNHFFSVGPFFPNFKILKDNFDIQNFNQQDLEGFYSERN